MFLREGVQRLLVVLEGLVQPEGVREEARAFSVVLIVGGEEFLYPFAQRSQVFLTEQVEELLAAVSAFMPAETYLRCFAGAFGIGAALGILQLTRSRGSVHTMHFALPVAASVFLHLAGLY